MSSTAGRRRTDGSHGSSDSSSVVQLQNAELQITILAQEQRVTWGPMYEA